MIRYLILKAIINPKNYFCIYLNNDFSGKFVFFRYGIFIALIGPVLSLYSLTTQSGYSLDKSLIYGIITYFMDLIVVVLFSIIISFLEKVSVDNVLKAYVLVNILIWFFDVFDIYQPLRIVTNVGFFYSFYLLWIGLGCLRINMKILFLVMHGIFYVVNAFLSEFMALNPLIRYFLK